MSLAQHRTMRTISAAASGVPSPQVSGFDSFEEPFGVLFNHAALGQLHEHVRQRNRAKLSWARLRHLLPWLWLLGTTIKWGKRGRRL